MLNRFFSNTPKNSSPNDNSNNTNVIFTGMLSRALVAGGMRPIDVLRARVQTDAFTHEKGTQAFSGALKKGQTNGFIRVLQSLFSGVIPRAAHASARDGLRLSSTMYLDNSLGNSETDVKKSASKFAAVVAIDVALIPFDNIVLSTALNPGAGIKPALLPYKNAIGFSGALKIAYPTDVAKFVVPKQFIQGGTVIVVGDYFNGLFRDEDGKLSNRNAFLSATSTAAVAATLTYPFDYGKTLAQGKPNGILTYRQAATCWKNSLVSGSGTGTGFALRFFGSFCAVLVKTGVRAYTQQEKPMPDGPGIGG